MIRPPRWPVLLLASSMALAGCAASARFYSKNGQVYREVTQQAVRCDEGEIRLVMAAGGFPIGVIDARALTVRANDDDLMWKAAKIAAKNGGTHILLTERGIETFTTLDPAQRDRSCSFGDMTVDCQTTYMPPTMTTYEKPTAKFVVFVVPPDRWARLPPALRPGAQR